MHSTRSFYSIRLCLLALSIAPLIAEAAAIGQSAVGSLDRRVKSGCTISGNSDLYGLGVRLGLTDHRNPPGVYSQWVTCFLANRYVLDEISGSLDANSIFLLALLIGMLRNTIQKDQINLLDALVLIQLCFGYLFSVLSLFGYRTRFIGKTYTPTLGTYIRLFLAGAISGYGVWFWFEGAEHLPRGECGPPVMFFFAKIEVLGGFKYFWKVVAIFCSLYFFSVFLAGFLTFLLWVGVLIYTVVSSTKGIRNEWDNFWEIARRKDTAEPVNKKQARRAYNILSVLNFLAIPWFIISTELVLNWNHITGVTGTEGLRGTGQLIPALIGLGGLIRIIWIIVANDMDERARKRLMNRPANGEHQSSLPNLPPALQRARSIAFRLNSQVLLKIISLGFITDMIDKNAPEGEELHDETKPSDVVEPTVTEVAGENPPDSHIAPA
ncbi:MAG: hypothetical protein M1840_008664 [Geoglossum simile]|nr:MAG: hypothetical protein M1840_008664 [Geoglossum simile]